MLRRIILLLTSVWLITAVALAARAGFVWDQQQKIPHEVLATVPFDNEAGNIANALVEGRGFSDVFRKPTGPTAWLAPVYPVVLAGVFRSFGTFTYQAFLLAALLNCVFSALATVPLFFLARRIGGVAVAAVSAWVWAFSPAGVMLPFEWIWDTSLSVALATTIVWATLEISPMSPRWKWVAYGGLWGVALLTNPALGILLPFLLVWLTARKPDGAQREWKGPALAAAIAILFCVPWTIRNYTQFHRVIPLRSNFAFEWWIGNNDIFDEHMVGGVQRITRFGEVRLYTQLGETAYMEEKRRLAWEFIQMHRALELRLIGRRIVATWLATEHPWRDFWSTDSWVIRIIFVFNGLATVGTVVGIILLFVRRSPYAVPLALVPLLFPVVYYATHTSLRYRHPIDAVLMLFAAIALIPITRKRAFTPQGATK